MNYRLVFFTMIFFLMFLTSVHAQLRASPSPPVLDLGEIEREQTKIATFNVITSSEDTLLVTLEAARGKADFFSQSNYHNYIYNYSEEDIKNWIKFYYNPVELQPFSLPGSTIKNAAEISFSLTVPKEAEPGYHTGYINLDPKTMKETSKQITIKAVAPLTVLFKVPGDAIREGKIYDVTVKGYSSNVVYFDVIFQNTGTVTLLAKSGSIKIFDEENNFVGEISIPSNYVKPGELKVFKTLWQVNDSFVPGTYKIETKISYSSGQAEKTTYIQLRELPKPPKTPTPKFVEKEEGISLWVILIALLVILIVYWRYKK